jgi:hypothetical protein
MERAMTSGHVLLTIALAYPMTCVALAKPEVCQFRAAFVTSFAESRDAGKPQEATLAEAKREFAKRGWPVGNLLGYIKIVYQSRDFTPRQLHDVFLMTCLKE